MGSIWLNLIKSTKVHQTIVKITSILDGLTAVKCYDICILYRVPKKKRGSSNFHDYAIFIAKTSNLFTGTTPNITLAVNIDVNISFKIVYMKKNCKISRWQHLKLQHVLRHPELTVNVASVVFAFLTLFL